MPSPVAFCPHCDKLHLASRVESCKKKEEESVSEEKREERDENRAFYKRVWTKAFLLYTDKESSHMSHDALVVQAAKFANDAVRQARAAFGDIDSTEVREEEVQC